MKDNNDKCDLCGKDRDSHIGDDATCTGYFLPMKDKEALIAEIKYLIEFPFKQATAEEIFNLCATYQDEWISELKQKAKERSSIAQALSKCAMTADHEAEQEGRLRELNWLLDELDPPQPPTSKNNEA